MPKLNQSIKEEIMAPRVGVQPEFCHCFWWSGSRSSVVVHSRQRVSRLVSNFPRRSRRLHLRASGRRRRFCWRWTGKQVPSTRTLLFRFVADILHLMCSHSLNSWDKQSLCYFWVPFHSIEGSSHASHLPISVFSSHQDTPLLSRIPNLLWKQRNHICRYGGWITVGMAHKV